MADTGTPDAGGATPAAGQSASVEPISLSDDSLVKLPGSDKPVKWGEHYRGFQSEFTKKAQAAAAYEKRQAELERKLNEQMQANERLQQFVRTQTGGQQQAPDPFATLKTKTYLDGETAYELAQRLKQEIGGVGQEFGKRDEVLRLVVQHLLNQEKQLQAFSGTRAQEVFDAKIKKVVSDLGYDSPDVEDLAKEIYLAYDGEDLDQEFPNILKKRIEQIQNWTRMSDKKRAESARRLPFTPGKGGNGSAQKPLSLAGKSHREIADLLWPGVESGDET